MHKLKRLTSTTALPLPMTEDRVARQVQLLKLSGLEVIWTCVLGSGTYPSFVQNQSLYPSNNLKKT